MGPQPALFVVCALLLPFLAAEPLYSRYIVIGAGPGGLQIAHYLQSARRDYLLLDAAPSPASFFSHYPRFRQLISINKREVGRNDSLAFSERHDWNSLLSDPSHALPGVPVSTTDARLDPASQDPRLRFTSYSAAYYPHADDLVSYLAAWAAEPRNATPLLGLGRAAPLNARYNTRVLRVARPPSWLGSPPLNSTAVALGEPRFLVHTTQGEFACTFLIVAVGLQEPVPLPSHNGTAAVAAGLVHTYATAPADAAAYKGKRVLVLGHGNGAWEFAHHALAEAAFVHVAGRPTSRLKLALESHYPGHVRAVHGTLLETYNLKSLDGITSTPFEKLTFSRGQGGGVVVASGGSSGCGKDALGRATGRCSFREPYDIVVACLGWRFSLSLFDEGCAPRFSPNGKHPASTARYESPNVAGLFFAGTVAHAADFKKASGGFIHGFRYTARALHRILEEEEADAAAAASGDSGAVAMAAAAAGVVAAAGGGGRSAAPPPPPPTPLRAGPPRAPTPSALLLRCCCAAPITERRCTKCSAILWTCLYSRRCGRRTWLASSRGGCTPPWRCPGSFLILRRRLGQQPTPLGLRAMWQPFSPPPPPAARPRRASALASEAAVDAAVAGGLREEVPVGAAGDAARRWAAAEGGSSGAAEWLQLSLEFGPSPPPGEKDPFALSRANVGLRTPEASHFLHPVLRYFHAATPGCGGKEQANSSPGCAPVAELHLIEDFHARWDLHTPHVLPLGRFLQALGVRRAASALADPPRRPVPLPPWPTPAPPHPFLAGILAQLLSGCEAATLHWGGAAFSSAGEEGWWMKMSLAAEASLAELRGLAVHATDSAPGVAVSAEEEAHTQSVREKWAWARERNGSAEGGGGPEELDRPAVTAERAAAFLVAQKEAAAAYGALTRKTKGLGVLVVEGRGGRCKVLAERLGVKLGGVRVFDAESAGEGGTRGTATDVEGPRGGLSPKTAAPHIKAVFARVMEKERRGERERRSGGGEEER